MGNKLIAIALLCAASLFGQSTQGVVFANPASGVTSNLGNTNFQQILGSQYMIGQLNHLLIAVFGDITANSCTDPRVAGTFSAPIVDIYGSFDGTAFDAITTYTRVVSPGASTSATDRFRIMSTAVGAFPFIRVNVSAWNSLSASGCKLSLYYYGSQSAFDPKIVPGYQGPSPLFSNTFIITTATTTVVSPSINNAARISVYGITLINNAASINTVTVQDRRTDSSVVALLNVSLPANGSITLNNSDVPYFQTSAGGTLVILTGNTNTVSGYVVTRSE